MTWVNTEIVTLSEVSHTQKDENIIGYCLHVESTKKTTKKGINELICKIEIELQMWKKLMLTKG